MDHQQALITTHNLCRTYQMGETKVHALRNVNLEIQHGEFVAIIGPSGSGKSTLLNLLGCLDTPSAGDYFLDGQKIDSDSNLAQIRRGRIGFVFQFFNLLPKHTAAENVELPMIYKGLNHHQRKKRAVELLTQMGLAERINHRPNELSGGQKQRVAMARALANQPQIVFADEPTGNLDSKTGALILDELESLNRERETTLAIVTHDENIAKRANRIIRLFDGEVVGS